MKNIFRRMFILVLCAPLAALAWTPGAAHPDCPHVVAGEEAGTWRPEEGWAFANDEPDDLSVVPVDGTAWSEEMFEPPKPFAWLCSGVGMVEIPAPEGFLSMKPGTLLADYYARIASADPDNTMMANWVELRDDGIACDAYINVLNALRGKRITLSEFRQLVQATAKSLGTDDEGFEETLERSGKEAGAILQEMGMDGNGFSFSGMKWLPPHRNEDGRMAFTMVSNSGFGDDVIWTANSCCLLWLHGNVLHFYMAQHAGSAEALDGAIAESRRKLDLWCDAVVAACRSRGYAAGSLTGDLLLENRNIELERDLSRKDMERIAREGNVQGRLIAAGLFAFVLVVVALVRRARSGGSPGGQSEK